MGRSQRGRFNDHNVSPNTNRRSHYKPVRQKNKYPYEKYRSFYNQNGRYMRHNTFQNNYNKKWIRAPSPVIGSEEYMTKKIQNTSALIMRHLLSPEDSVPLVQTIEKQTDSEIHNTSSQTLKKTQKRKTKFVNKRKNNVKTYNVEEIHNKIMNHICNLNDGRKKNLIYSSSSGYDNVIQNLMKQKRLEISRALRNMCSGENEITESSEFINSIIPDIGIKIEDLPRELIEELTRTFDNQIENFTDEEPREEPSVFINPIDLEATDEQTPNNNLQEAIVQIESIKEEPMNEDLLLNDPFNLGEEEIEIKQESYCQDSVINNVAVTIEKHVNANLNIDYSCEKLSNTPTSLSNIFGDVDNSEQAPCLSSTSQTSCNENISNISVKHEPEEDISAEIFLRKWFGNVPKSLGEAVGRMLEIDQIISKLTTYRQDLFNNFLEKPKTEENKGVIDRTSENMNNIESESNRNSSQTYDEYHLNSVEVQQRIMPDSMSSEIIQQRNEQDVVSLLQQRNILQLQVVQEKMLVLKVVGDQLIAGTESGKIFFCCLDTGSYTNIIQVTVTPITSLSISKGQTGNVRLYIGSLENSLNIYNLAEQRMIKSIELEDSVRCMEESWGYIFIGSPRGFLFRYSIRKEEIEFEEKFNDTGIQVLKATSEGARRVLLVASRDSEVHVRDAISGLCLRTISSFCASLTSTQCLIFLQSNLYCGTNNDLNVFSFHDGRLIHTFKKTKTKGVNDLKVLGQLLFAGCENGNVNVYSLKSNTFVDSISGPGGSIIAMEVLDKQVIVSTSSLKFKSIPIPEHILIHN